MDSQDCILLKQNEAKQKGCRDDSFLEGVVCTNRCSHRHNCEVKRVPFLIQVQVNEIRRTKDLNKKGIAVKEFAGREERIRGVPCLCFPLLGRRTEEYIVGTGGL